MLSRILSVPDELQLSATKHFGQAQFRHLLHELARNGAVGPRMLDLLLKEKWPEFAAKTGEWRWLYVARCADPPLVKIGISVDPVQRMVSLNTSVPGKLRAPGMVFSFDLVGALPCCRELHESFLCEMFSGSLAAGREWFRDTVATRILCWHFARLRSGEAPRAERNRIGWEIREMFIGLRYVCRGIEPNYGYGLNQYGQRCGVCRSRRHTRPTCPSRFGASTEAA